MNDLTFRTRARLIDQLGEQLIKSENIALLELVKNSYDADSSKCTVNIKNADDPLKGRITIEDDGCGMNYKILTTSWLEIGTDSKSKKKEDKDYLTPKYHRRPQGEKGIGRLGVHRLGREINIVTSDDGITEHTLSINWDKISSVEFIEEIPFEAKSRPCEVFKGKTGTKITITRLKNLWTKKMIRDAARALTSLSSPFEPQGKFKTELSIDDPSFLDGLLKTEDIAQYKLFYFDVAIKGNIITRFNYKFTPWPIMKKIRHRSVGLNDISGSIRMVRKKKQLKDDESLVESIDLSKYNIGEVRLRGYIFDFDTNILKHGVADKKGLKDFVQQNGGFRVYRDNIRVYDYGEPGNDWLGLDSRRVNLPTGKFSNNIVISNIYLHHSDSKDLIEKANREGFVENSAFIELKDALLFVIDRLETQRKIDKNLLRKYYNTADSKEPVTSTISELKNVVEQKVSKKEDRKELFRYIDRITKEYKYITESLIKSAGAGLNLIIVIHQIEKIIKNIRSSLKKKAYHNVEKQMQVLSTLVEGYSVLVKKSEIKYYEIQELLDMILFNIEIRLEMHGIELEFGNMDRAKSLYCSKSHILNAMINIFDNSIWWLEYAQVKDPSIFLDIIEIEKGYLTLVVADNGPGFSLPSEDIIQPFISAKPDGMGIGLHIIEQIMQSLNGTLSFPSFEDLEIPQKFKTGAIIALSFKTGVPE